jgi:hypothetical protein
VNRYLRHPHTTQERRESLDGWGRPCRNNHNLAQAWDDIWIRYQRSWKKYRKTQYNEKDKNA